MHFHIHSFIDYKIVKKSAILLICILLIIALIDVAIGFNGTLRLVIYSSPFFSHAFASVFMKKRESWLLGAILGTIVSLLLFVVSFFLFIY